MENIPIAIIFTILGGIIGFLTFTRNRDKDIKNESKQDGIIETKLDYISKGVDDIRIDNKARDKQIQDVVKELAEVKQSVKSAHHRIDNLEKGDV
ncbi:hypothetical protein [Clostridium sp. LP20]|uniref:hypothetical protein n=1 Tax=Clostridium sp. LP20 TaxID=3418665 RepID=UPI003EE715F7